MTQLRINTLTALPALKYLLAEAGLEPPLILPDTAWPVYERFVKLEAESREDVATFQAHRLNDEAAMGYEIVLGRQLTDDDEEFPQTRLIAIQFVFDSFPADLEDIEVWSDAFPSLDKFLNHIERLPELRFAFLEGTPLIGDAILYDDDAVERTDRRS